MAVLEPVGNLDYDSSETGARYSSERRCGGLAVSSSEAITQGCDVGQYADVWKGPRSRKISNDRYRGARSEAPPPGRGGAGATGSGHARAHRAGGARYLFRARVPSRGPDR